MSAKSKVMHTLHMHCTATCTESRHGCRILQRCKHKRKQTFSHVLPRIYAILAEFHLNKRCWYSYNVLYYFRKSFLVSKSLNYAEIKGAKTYVTFCHHSFSSDQGGDTPYTKARRFLSTCERGHLGLRSIARVIILWENYLNLQRK